MQGDYGWCKTRVNKNGAIYTLIYGNISSISLNPIEKKPLFHFYPGSFALTIGSWSCNFNCPWCQNWDISKSPPREGEEMSPQEFVNIAKEYKAQGTSISFNEPTLLLEWSIEVFKIAKKEGLYNTFVTNGYMSEEAAHLLFDSGLDAVNIDIKGDRKTVRKYCDVDGEKVWRNAKFFKKKGVHLELTTLVIPGVNDEYLVLKEIARRIVNELGENTPWHVNRYFPDYKFFNPPTPVKTLERAYEIGKGEGLNYVYIGNLHFHPFENTYCLFCNALLIERSGGRVKNNLREKKCPGCGKEIPIIL